MTPTPLKRAIFESGRRQIVIAERAGIHESRLSKLANGYLEPNEHERRALARILRLPIAELFPPSDVEAAS